MKKRILLLTFSFICSLIFAEIALRTIYPQKTYSVLYDNAISCFAKSDRTVFTLKPNCTFSFTDFDTGEKFQTKTNSLGYRGENFDLTKKSGEKRVIMEGDSFILGFGVQDENLVSAKLEKSLSESKSGSLKGTKVINAGYRGGFGPDGYFLQQKYEGMKLEPDLVVFSIFVYNDFSDIDNSEWIGVGPYGEPQRVVSKTVQVDKDGHLLNIDTPFIYKIPVIRNSHLVVFFYNSYKLLQSKVKKVTDTIKFKIIPPNFSTGDAKDSNLPGVYWGACLYHGECHRKINNLFYDLSAVIKAASELKNEKTGKKPAFLVIVIPADFQIYKEALKKYTLDDGITQDLATNVDPNPQKKIKEALDSEKIPYIDLLPVMRVNKEVLYDIADGHWNKKGHEVAASEINKWIENNYR